MGKRTKGKNSQRSRTKSKRRQEVTNYNQAKDRPMQNPNHADLREPETLLHANLTRDIALTHSLLEILPKNAFWS